MQLLSYFRIYPQITTEELYHDTIHRHWKIRIPQKHHRKKTPAYHNLHPGSRTGCLGNAHRSFRSWSSLLWNILTYEEICHQFYEKERQIHILGDRTCEAYLNQMEQQGLIVSGHGITGADALHDLLNRLYVIPVTSNLLTRSAAFLHLTLAKHIPLKVTKKIFAKPQFNETEKQLMRLVKQNQLSVGELVKCVECGIVDVSTNDKLVDALYDDEETTYRNIGQIWRGCESNNPVLAGIATLYLNKHVIFDVLE